MNARHEILFKQLSAYRNELLGLVEGVTEEEAGYIPSGFNNNIRWNLGHVVLDQYLWIQAVTGEAQPVSPDWQRWFGYGTSPADFEAETPDVRQIMAVLQQQPERIREQYGSRLEEDFAPTEMGMHTVEQVLIRTIFHEGLHIGAIQAIKRQLALKTAE